MSCYMHISDFYRKKHSYHDRNLEQCPNAPDGMDGCDSRDHHSISWLANRAAIGWPLLSALSLSFDVAALDLEDDKTEKQS